MHGTYHARLASWGGHDNALERLARRGLAVLVAAAAFAPKTTGAFK
jgi:hypothetical protein